MPRWQQRVLSTASQHSAIATVSETIPSVQASRKGDRYCGYVYAPMAIGRTASSWYGGRKNPSLDDGDMYGRTVQGTKQKHTQTVCCRIVLGYSDTDVVAPVRM